MAEKCTKTSSPVERWINPYPFAPLNHLTVPFSLTEKTPFAQSLRIILRNPRSSPRPTEAPLKKTGRNCYVEMRGRSDPKRQRLLSSSPACEARREPQEPDTLALFRPLTTNVNSNCNAIPDGRPALPT